MNSPSTGYVRILDIVPKLLHQRVLLILGVEERGGYDDGVSRKHVMLPAQLKWRLQLLG